MSSRASAPRELVVASAGAGKTYHLSSRIIELLAAGAEPEEVFASTFTRKAAGEILERVLLRLARGALDPEGARELNLTPSRCLELLETLVPRLHAVNVGTLDSFFQRVARAFTLDLGLPPGWTLADPPAEARLRSEATSQLLARADDGATVELLRLLHDGDAGRRVHDLLLDQVADLHDLYLELDPEAADPWGFAPEDRDWGGLPTPDEVREVARRLADAPVPLTGSGKPDGRWVRARDQAVERLERGELEDFATRGLGAKVVAGEWSYYGKEMPLDLAAPLQDGLALVRRMLGPRLQARAGALGRLLPLYHRWIGELRDERGLYRFDDITRTLARTGAGGRGAELHYRLDARVRHILLDEFQDTSRSQWWALRPLVDEILSGYEGERAAVIVADPKQSIYGWRGGEPRILDAIQRDFSLPTGSLHRSWRSSQVVLDFVNRVFGGLAGAGSVSDEDRPTVERWLEGFTEHEPARPELPGHVTVEVGPGGDDARKSILPRLLAAGAARAAEIHRACPGASIGILTRSNKAVARLMGELRHLGVEASEEGGVPVVDSPAVLSLLALLQMADHPGDSVARYQVAHTPVRELTGPFDWRSPADAEGVAGRVRRRLAAEGYGPVVGDWVRRLGVRATPRDRRRLRQLAELAHRWDERADLRPGRFVRWVSEERVEDPAAARVRVMTVHQSKGLEFDVVVLPDLDQSLLPRGGGGVLPWRREPDAPVERIYPGIKRGLLPLFPRAEPAAAQLRAAALRDGLSGLYVAITRARFAVEVLIKPDGSSRSTAFTAAALVRDALDVEGRIVEGQVLYDGGSKEWWSEAGAPERLRPSSADEGESRSGMEVQAGDADPRESEPRTQPLLRPRERMRRRRLLPHRTPSEMEGGGGIRLEYLLRDRGREARGRGSVVHAWLERMEWMEEGFPPEAELKRVAREVAPGLMDVDALLTDLRGWLQAPEIREALSRDRYPAGAGVDRERPFLLRDQGRLVQGVVDRLVRAPSVQDGVQAWVLDFKTDRLSAGDEREIQARSEFYRPQLATYRRAVAREEGFRQEEVAGGLAFLVPGRVVWL